MRLGKWPGNWMLIALCCWSTGAAAAQNDLHIPAYQRVVLDNGTTLLLMERHDVPLIAFRAVLRGGALADTAGKAGATNLLAQLLLKGAGTRDARQFAEAVASVGGSFDADAATESIWLNGQFMARDQELMIELLADVLQRPQLQRSQFDSLRQRQIEFLRAAKNGNVGALTPIYAAAALFGSHPYGRPVAGSELSLAQLQFGDVQQLYQQQLGADRLILAVTGDFNAREMQTRLRRAFGKWRKARTPLPTVPPVSADKPGVVLIDAPDSVQTYFWIGSLGVARNDARRVPLQLVNTLFGGRFTSMLNTELRIKSGLTYGARAQQRQLLQGGSWNMYSFTQTDTTVQAIDLALQTYRRLRTDGLNETELTSGKNYILGQYPTGYETAAQWAATLADLEFYELSRDEVDAFAERLRAVTPQQSGSVINMALPAENDLLLVLIGNAAMIRSQVAKYGPVVELHLSTPGFAIPPRKQGL
jgi:zinc protease